MFSIIIPTFNRKNVLRHCILALIKQGNENYEVIVCDDGSNDGTEEMINELKKQVPFDLLYTFQEKKGFRLAKARNMGIRLAKAEKIVFLDQDVIISPFSLEQLNKFCFDNKYSCGYKRLMPIQFYEEKINDDIILNNFSIFDSQYHGMIPATLGSFGMIYKKCFDIVGLFDEDFVGWGLEDSELIGRLNDNGIKGNSYKIFGFHVEHEKGIMSKETQALFHAKRKK